MSASMNRVWLCGTLGQYPFTLRYLPSGSAVATGSLTVTETGRDGREYNLFIAIEAYGSKAEAVSELQPGTLVMVEGKLSRRKARDEKWELCVSTYDVQPLGVSAAGTTHRVAGPSQYGV
jgi:single-stranded DNA-binding protein